MKKIIYCSGYNFISLEDLQNANYDPATETGDPTWLTTETGDTYIKYGKDKWLRQSSNGHVISEDISDIQLFHRIEDQKVKLY